tara:strand:+ start:522 stop:1508 length:987 start_codon:yes stop_codon:yes gene_type:complete
MKKNDFIGLMMLAMLVSIQAFSQVDVTFRVDMTGQTIDANGVHIAGSIQGWDPSTTMLAQEGTTEIYSVVLQVSPGWQEYKFVNGNDWGFAENPSYPCAGTNGNRYLYINDSGNNVVLEAVPFNGCNASGTGFELTFNVDMSSEGTVPAGNVRLAGWYNGWNSDVFALPNVSGNIHSGTLRLPTPSNYAVTTQYKYVNNGAWENLDPACATVVSPDNNRLVTANNSGDAVGDVFNGCTFPLSIEDFTENTFKISYNKSERLANIFSVGYNNEIAKVQVFDMSGKSIQTKEHITAINDIQIDFQNQTNGIYFVRIESEGKQWVKKIMIY